MRKAVIIGSKRKAEIFEHLLNTVEGFELVGFIDPDDSDNYSMLGEMMFALEIAALGDVFFIDRHVKNLPLDVICHLVKLGKHLFLDGYRPLNTGEIEQLQKYRTESGVIIQIGNVLHNKPLFTSALQLVKKPRYIKLEKHCHPPVAGEFAEWMHTNLFQEIDLIQRTMLSRVRSISARPMFLFGKQTDLLNIHLEFDNDAIAQISAGRAMEPGTYGLKIFQQDRLFLLNFSNHELIEYRTAAQTDQLSLSADFDHPELPPELIKIERQVMPFDTWKMELRNFLENIDKGLTPLTNLEHAMEVRGTCEWAIEKIQRKYQDL
ncbi:MAG: hypothetical protein FJX91_00320 [Bacteroidetes bacterium]|nr:hypothetical protein [Bacteroidota bacterium]